MLHKFHSIGGVLLNQTTGLLSVEQAAHYLGLSKFTIYTWVSQGRIPYIKLGRRTLFSKEDLDGIIAANTIHPKAA
jgi:excisionase family DNA binding protein